MPARSKKPAKPPAKKTTKPAPGKLAGKTVAFVGKFGYSDMFRERYEGYATQAGATVVDADTTVPDYLVAGEGRGGKPPGAVAKFNKQHPEVPVLEVAELCQMLVPSPEALLAEWRRGPSNDQDYWDRLNGLFAEAQTTIDLRGADLRQLHFDPGAHFERLQVDGADLRHIAAHYAHLPLLMSVKLDEADLSNAYFSGAQDSSFRKTNLRDCWLSGTYGQAIDFKRCDFTGATLAKSRLEGCRFDDCTFDKADLSDAEMEKVDWSGINLTGINLSRAHASEAKFVGTDLSHAVLHHADLRGANLARADLRDADLREAVLSGADLTGTRIEGADFAGAVLSDAKLKGLDLAKAKNLRAPVVRQAGPKLKQLARGAGNKFETKAEIDLGKGEHANLGVRRYTHARGSYLAVRSTYQRDDNRADDQFDVQTIEEALLKLAERWPGATLRLDTIQVSGCRTPRGQELQELAMAAWAEAFGIEAATVADLEAHKAAQETALAQLRATMRKELTGGPAGLKKWNARSEHERAQVGPLHNLDLHKANLAGAQLYNCDLTGSNFHKTNLRKAMLSQATLAKANLADADLREAQLSADLSNANLSDANLAGAYLSHGYLNDANCRGADFSGAAFRFTCLVGADLTGAKLDGADLRNARYDGKTRFPDGFTPPPDMEWSGPPPQLLTEPVAPGSMSFDTFFEQLGYKADAAKLDKALKMLKSDRFQLFADVKNDQVVGIVKSQTDKDLVYSCRLTSSGDFSCCTQNLKPCGGLQGSLCKHLLVLIVGLAKAEKLDAATVHTWVNASAAKKPALDKDAMSETFLRYKGAEAGEVDWRPTETIPEDYYAL